MKRAIGVLLILVLGFSLMGCGGPGGSDGNSGDNGSPGGSAQTQSIDTLDRSFSMVDGKVTFNVSSSWKEEVGDLPGGSEEFTFETESGAILSVVYFSFYNEDPYEEFELMKEYFEYSDVLSNLQDISSNEFTRNGVSFVVFEYSYDTRQYGDKIEINAYISKGDSRIVIYFIDSADQFNRGTFDALLDSFQWK